MLLECLRSDVSLTDSFLDWVRSFLTDRTQQIAYSSHLSSVQSVLFGVPQGSVLGPLLYVLYTAELAFVVNRHGLSLQPMTLRSTSAHRLVTLRLPSDVSLRVSSTSRHE